MRGLVVAAAALVAVLVLAAVAGDDARARPVAAGLPHVTLIGDSIATSLRDDRSAARILGQGADVDLQVAPCRRLVAPSCSPNPPTAAELIRKLGSGLGAAVVVAVGYNELEDQYSVAIEDTLDEIQQAGVDRVFWLTLRANRHPYVTMNDDIEAAAARHRELTVIDWNLYSRSHPDWFQDDGLHLLGNGASAMATLIRQKLVAAGLAVPEVSVKTAALPDARKGKAYSARLAAQGGRGPYTWSLAGRLPLGLHLRPGGAFWGTPRGHTGRFGFTVRVRDAVGQTESRPLVLRVR